MCACVYNWIAKILAFVSKCEWKWNENRIKSFQFSHSYNFFYSFRRYCWRVLNIFFFSPNKNLIHVRTLKFSVFFVYASAEHSATLFEGYSKNKRFLSNVFIFSNVFVCVCGMRNQYWLYWHSILPLSLLHWTCVGD